MSERERKPDTYHWVIGEDGDDPAIALWDGDTWTFPQHDFDGAYYLHHVFRVGIGGGLDAPPDEWVEEMEPKPAIPLHKVGDVMTVLSGYMEPMHFRWTGTAWIGDNP